MNPSFILLVGCANASLDLWRAEGYCVFACSEATCARKVEDPSREERRWCLISDPLCPVAFGLRLFWRSGGSLSYSPLDFVTFSPVNLSAFFPTPNVSTVSLRFRVRRDDRLNQKVLQALTYERPPSSDDLWGQCAYPTSASV